MDPNPHLLDYLLGIMAVSALLGGLVVYLALDVIAQFQQYRGSAVHANVQHADQQIRDLSAQAQSELLRLVAEARRRDGYGP